MNSSGDPAHTHLPGRPVTVAITIWGRRISPVFDAATTLLLVELAGTGPINLSYHPFQQGNVDEVLTIMREYRATTLVCGAISAEPARKLEAGGVTLLAFVSGRADQIADLLWRNQPLERYRMPGCTGRGNGLCGMRGRIRKNSGWRN